MMAIVVLCDLTIYRGDGFAGHAALFVVAPLLLLLGTERLRPVAALWVLAPMLLLLAARMLWCGSALALVVGFALLVCFAMSLNGIRPYLLEAVVFASQTVHAGYRGLVAYWRSLAQSVPVGRTSLNHTHWLAILLPFVAFVAFSLLFTLANPDLLEAISKELARSFEVFRVWLVEFSPQPLEVLFCLAVGWVTIGLLRPLMAVREVSDGERPPVEVAVPPAPAPLYAAVRNTLAVVIALFSVYLVFEFKTLWFRVFPKGFHYSGYAHEGAAWLTVALALATVTLSLIFRGRILNDDRVRRLRTLAWFWSIENIVLAIAVFHRLFIYIGFNGMTRMRTIGLLGSSAVLVGFILVLWKIAHNRNFVWLLRRHLWTVAIAVYLYAVLPVDALVMSYNVGRIMGGDPAPCVQISVHPTSPEGLLLLRPLLTCKDDLIRQGVLAMLAERDAKAESLVVRRRQDSWTAFQVAEDRLLSMLRAEASEWSDYVDQSAREAALSKFHKYAYQWF